jgi:metal-responsive CopG/Arc/MetJ family transcriptional regulator
MMRITVEIDEKQLDALRRYTGIQKKSPAVAEAIQEYICQKEKEKFLKRVLNGDTDFQTANEQIEEATRWD